ncbi:unnamed protein product, partial [Rotaria sp. Silwood1]
QQTFNRSKIVERAVHACGSEAFGYFEVTHDVSSLCKADFLSKVVRNSRGIAMKFYTDEENNDIL